MKFLKYLLTITTVVFVIISCTERIDIDEDLGAGFPTYAVVEALINTDTTEHLVKLTRSKRLDDTNAVGKITNADVRISGNGQEVLLTEREPGFYYTPSDFFVIVGQRYYLTIDGVDINDDGIIDLITATDSVPSVPILDSIQIEYIEPWEAWSVNTFAQEPGNEENFYFFRASINNTMVSDTLYEIRTTDDYLINGSYISGLPTYYFNAEDPSEVLTDGDTITLEISGISSIAYEFIIQAQTESGYSSPLFSGPPSNVDHNMEGVNVFGAFITFSSSRASKIWRE